MVVKMKNTDMLLLGLGVLALGGLAKKTVEATTTKSSSINITTTNWNNLPTETITNEMMSKIQPFDTPPIVLTERVLEWNISERNNPDSPPLYPYLPGTYMGPNNSGGDIANITMQFRDALRSGGYRSGILHVTRYVNGLWIPSENIVVMA